MKPAAPVISHFRGAVDEILAQLLIAHYSLHMRNPASRDGRLVKCGFDVDKDPVLFQPRQDLAKRHRKVTSVRNSCDDGIGLAGSSSQGVKRHAVVVLRHLGSPQSDRER